MNIKVNTEKFVTMVPGDIITIPQKGLPIMLIGSEDAYEVVALASGWDIDKVGDTGLANVKGSYSIGSVKDGMAYDETGGELGIGDWHRVLANAIQ